MEGTSGVDEAAKAEIPTQKDALEDAVQGLEVLVVEFEKRLEGVLRLPEESESSKSKTPPPGGVPLEVLCPLASNLRAFTRRILAVENEFRRIVARIEL